LFILLQDQKSIENEMNTSLHFLDKKSSLKLKYEEDVLNELKKQLFANNNCVQINNRISKLKIQNKEHVLFHLIKIILLINVFFIFKYRN
jgi:hypothetical protein